MQGKEASEQETKVQSNVGIDVSKYWLDAHVLPGDERLHVANTCAGIRRLKRWLSRYQLALVAIEATGKWHRHVQRSLVASAIPVAIVDPYRVRMFAKAQGILAKTDQLDARVLALFAAMMARRCVRWHRRPWQNSLNWSWPVSAPSKRSPRSRTSSATAESTFLKRQLDRRISRAGKDIAALDREILKRIKADGSLARRYAVLTSIPSFGFAVAATIIACLAEIGSTTAKQIGMLAGLAPIADQSGDRERCPRHLGRTPSRAPRPLPRSAER